MSQEKLKIIHIEDEPEARKLLSSIISKYVGDDAEYVQSASTLAEGYELIKNSVFDLLFLDLQLINMDGMTLIDEFPQIAQKTILCTADDSKGVEALNAGCFYYLLKPLDIQEIIDVIQKFKKKRIVYPVENNNNPLDVNFFKDKLIVKDRSGATILLLNDIMYLQADQNYTRIILSSKETYLTSKTLKIFEDLLQHKFIRISRANLINVDYIKRINKSEDGSVELSDGTILPLSERGRVALKALF